MAPRLLDLGLRFGYGFLLQLRDDCIGALNVYGSAAGGIAPEGLVIGQALADVAAIGILQQRTIAAPHPGVRWDRGAVR